MPKVIDLMQIDLEAGKNWLAEVQENRIKAIRKKNRNKYLNKIKTGKIRVKVKHASDN